MAGVQLEELAPRAQAVDGERRRGARGDQDAHGLGEVAQQGVHEHVHRARFHLVEVVEHQEPRRALERSELVGEGAAQDLGGRGARASLFLEHAKDRASEARGLAPEPFEQVAAEHHRVRVGRHQRIPDHGTRDRAHERREERRLAVAGVGDDQAQRTCGVVRQRAHELRSVEDQRAGIGPAQLGPIKRWLLMLPAGGRGQRGQGSLDGLAIAWPRGTPRGLAERLQQAPGRPEDSTLHRRGGASENITGAPGGGAPASNS